MQYYTYSQSSVLASSFLKRQLMVGALTSGGHGSALLIGVEIMIGGWLEHKIPTFYNTYICMDIIIATCMRGIMRMRALGTIYYN